MIYRSQSCTDSVSLNRSLNSHYWKTLSFLPRALAELQRLGPDCFLAKAQARPIRRSTCIRNQCTRRAPQRPHGKDPLAVGRAYDRTPL